MGDRRRILKSEDRALTEQSRALGGVGIGHVGAGRRFEDDRKVGSDSSGCDLGASQADLLLDGEGDVDRER